MSSATLSDLNRQILNCSTCLRLVDHRKQVAQTKRRAYLTQELVLLKQVRVIVALGGIAWKAYLASWLALGKSLPSPRPRFGHKAEVILDDRALLIGSYHPSRQNTQTGRLTGEMFESVFKRARRAIGGR